MIDKIKPTQFTHKFHFVLHKDLKDRIMAFAAKENRSFSNSVVTIINIIYPILMKRHFLDPEEKNRPDVVNWNTHGYVTMDRNLFRRIKQLHIQINIHSIAKLLRFLLYEFLTMYEKYGLSEVLKRVKKIEKEHFRNFSDKKVFDKRDMDQQLFHNYSYKEHYLITLSDEYQLLRMQILE